MTEIADAPRELLALACQMRGDWDREQTWNALLAVRTAGWTFAKTFREVTRLLLIEDSGPRDLRIAAGETRTAHPGHLPEDLRAAVLADCEAASEAVRTQSRAPEDDAWHDSLRPGAA